MKVQIILCLFLFTSSITSAQLSCQAPICLVDYAYHVDTSPNPIMAAIDSFRPAILITNTPHGYYGDQVFPSGYQAFGIQVYSYIVGGYEGSLYMSSEDDSAANIGRIDGIATDGADGVMLDQVSSTLTPHKKAYIAAMFDRCRLHGLKLILNPGDNSFDTFLVSHSDYVISSEHYTGIGSSPSPSELVAMSHMIVLNVGSVTTAAAAAAITDSARSQGYGYSYVCTDYQVIPAWLSTYKALITHATPTPTITASSNVFHSSAAYGNQWYSVSAGLIAGATGQSFTPNGLGQYYDIVTTANCPSQSSDTLILTTTDITNLQSDPTCRVYPNPAMKKIHVDNVEGATVKVLNTFGQVLVNMASVSDNTVIDIERFATGIYIVEVSSKKGKIIYRLAKD